jgi:hypothetical protein
LKNAIFTILIFTFSLIASNHLIITPTSSNWESAKRIDVKAITQSVASTVMEHFPSKKLNNIILENKEKGPKTLYKKSPNNEYIVWVNIKGRRWSQLIYQFSHEFAHILSNYTNKNEKNQWFEEALCEAISLYTLEKMSDSWKTNPPYPNWKSYAPSIKNYLNNVLNEKHREIQEDLSIWYYRNKHSLQDDPYIRNKNEIVGTKIYYLMKAGNFKLSTIQYLNLGKASSSKHLKSYLQEWYKNTPRKDGESILSIASTLPTN